MIARITYVDSEMGEVTATLGDDATWTADDPAMAMALNALIGSEDRSPARGDWLGWHAGWVGGLVGGKVEFEPKAAPTEAGVRY